ncbi:MAG: helix-turn-helix transcriptional regulator [Syntrophomonas sp.]
MNKKEFVKLMDEKLKLIRTEYGLTQDKMAAILGISKKTLIEIEKNRKSLGWTNSVALASIFSDSTILYDAIGGDMSDIIIAVAFKDVDVDYPKLWEAKFGGRLYPRRKATAFSRICFRGIIGFWIRKIVEFMPLLV